MVSGTIANIANVIDIMVFIRMVVQRPQLVAVEEQAVLFFQSVEAGVLGGQTRFEGEAAGGERFGERAFAQTPGARGQIGCIPEFVGGILAGLPGLERAPRLLDLAQGFGADFLQDGSFAAGGRVCAGEFGIPLGSA